MKCKGKTPEEIAREYRRGLRMKQGLLVLACVLYFAVLFWLIWRRNAGILAVLLGGLLLALCTFPLNIWISWDFLSLNRILNENCDPGTYAAVCRLLLGIHKRRRIRLHIAINEAIGIQWCGRFSEALDIVNRLAFPEKAAFLQLLAQNVRFNCFLKLEDPESARRVQEETERSVRTFWKPAMRKRGAEILSIMDCSIAYWKKDYETFRRLEEELSAGYTVNIQKVSSAFRLARADLAQGERESARTRLEMVAKQGGTLYIAEEARELLAELERGE